MFAKVLHDDTVYYSPVFAVHAKYPINKAVVFDSSFTQLIVVKLFHRDKYNVLFLDCDDTEFAIIENDFKSYWNDRNIFKTIKRKKYTPQMLEEAKATLRKYSAKGYTTIKTPSDLEALTLNTGSLHDGYVLGSRENNGVLEILFDSSWGSYLLLKCKDVIKNDLIPGQIFSYCDTSINNDCVELSFEPMSASQPCNLIAKHMEFKPLFEKRIAVKDFEYNFSDGNLSIKTDRDWIEINRLNNDILDFKERNVLGYLQNNDVMSRCLIFDNDIVYRYYKYANNPKKTNKTMTKVATFQSECKDHGFSFEQFPLFDDDWEFVYDYGQLLYRHEYSAFSHFLLTLKSFSSLFLILLIYNGSLLAQQKWMLSLIFGLSGVALLMLLVFIITLRRIQNNKETFYFEIYEKGIKHNSDCSFNVDYKNVRNVEYKNGIRVQAWIKFRIPRFKDDKNAYELLKKQFDEFKKETTD